MFFFIIFRKFNFILETFFFQFNTSLFIYLLVYKEKRTLKSTELVFIRKTIFKSNSRILLFLAFKNETLHFQTGVACSLGLIINQYYISKKNPRKKIFFKLLKGTQTRFKSGVTCSFNHVMLELNIFFRKTLEVS